MKIKETLLVLILFLILVYSQFTSAFTEVSEYGVSTDGNVSADWLSDFLEWTGIQNVPAGFADDIDNDTGIGHTHLSNFTDDILWTTLFNSTYSSYGLLSGFNSTYNATYDATTLAWEGNYSTLIGSVNNASYLSTYNATYDGTINNASYLSTYNSTYDAKVSYNITFNQSLTDLLYAGIEWDYNQTIATYNLYNAIWSTTYNSTYDATTSAWNGNFTILIGAINNVSYLSTYNSTYHGLVNNASYLSTYNATYHAKADYNFGSNNINGTGNVTASIYKMQTNVSYGIWANTTDVVYGYIKGL